LTRVHSPHCFVSWPQSNGHSYGKSIHNLTRFRPERAIHPNLGVNLLACLEKRSPFFQETISIKAMGCFFPFLGRLVSSGTESKTGFFQDVVSGWTLSNHIGDSMRKRELVGALLRCFFSFMDAHSNFSNLIPPPSGILTPQKVQQTHRQRSKNFTLLNNVGITRYFQVVDKAR